MVNEILASSSQSVIHRDIHQNDCHEAALKKPLPCDGNGDTSWPSKTPKLEGEFNNTGGIASLR
jgi:hypothetical protein